jgi:hypothetical protein
MKKLVPGKDFLNLSFWIYQKLKFKRSFSGTLIVRRAKNYRPSSDPVRPPPVRRLLARSCSFAPHRWQASRWLYMVIRSPPPPTTVPTAVPTVHPNYSTQYVWVSGLGGYPQIATHVAYVQPCDDLLSQPITEPFSRRPAIAEANCQLPSQQPKSSQ